MVFELKANDGKAIYSVESDNLSFIVKHYKKIKPKKKGVEPWFSLSNQMKFEAVDDLLRWVIEKAVIHEGTARSIEEILKKQQDLLDRIEAIVDDLEGGEDR